MPNQCFKKIFGITFLLLVAGFCLNTKIFAQDATPAPYLTSPKCNEFTFDASESYDPDNENISFLWSFGDGQTDTPPVVTHTYKKSGDYDVQLTITDNSGLECSTAVISQKVRANIKPQASFTAVQETCVNIPITFDGSESFDDVTTDLIYQWSFGDGTAEQGPKKVTHVYSRGGNYKARLTVDDRSQTICRENSVEKMVHVNASPVAEAGEARILKCIEEGADFNVEFDGSGSFDENNDKLTYYWDFGDGFNGEGVKVKHQYAQVGTYDAKLIVKDGTNLGCGTHVDFVTVQLNKAPKANAGNDVIACLDESIIFDGTQTYVHKKGTLDAVWNFGDGSSSNGLLTSHQFRKPGKYEASLTVENTLNPACPVSTDKRSVVINSPPTVSIKPIQSTCLGNKVSFDASSAADPDNDNLEYYWSFGDGKILKGSAIVEHQYKQGGRYRATVIVDDGQASTCSTATASVDVHINTPPIANAGPNLACCLDKVVNFDATASSDSDDDSLKYSWDFGDGTKSTGTLTSHTYTKNGQFDVVLTVKDDSGTSCSESTASFVANVNAKPVAVFNVR